MLLDIACVLAGIGGASVFASANLAMLEDKAMGLSVYLHSFCAVIGVLGVICCFFCVAIWRLLKE